MRDLQRERITSTIAVAAEGLWWMTQISVLLLVAAILNREPMTISGFVIPYLRAGAWAWWASDGLILVALQANQTSKFATLARGGGFLIVSAIFFYLLFWL